MSLLLPSLLGMYSLMILDLSDCNLPTIPNDFENLSSIIHLDLSKNHFSCLLESLVQLSKFTIINLRNCTRLRFVATIAISDLSGYSRWLYLIGNISK